ncbi:hypothetical protein [Flavobacterium cellulosilyticum]|uniref:Uncharacterized protein n=1 Tax=Flavobacterium cellulosilyticum TaxID=2541731 RepID=A0A4R5CA65_9FLAO|nr:hypothetical protein [Flavobacterium cellulosilyticum]TDD93922.1 hypothetical protein E0F76_18240 [Flavobacterium cellulosilyticum]
MKKSQNTTNNSSFENENKTPFKRILRTFFVIKDAFSFDVFTFLKAENEKLQIVFANIRV